MHSETINLNHLGIITKKHSNNLIQNIIEKGGKINVLITDFYALHPMVKDNFR